MTTTLKEQWEALVLESDHWKRPREVSKGTPKMDPIDEATIEDVFIREGSSKIDRMDTALSRFLKLMYTDQFVDFKERVLEDVNGLSSISDGVRDMVIDQAFRYFVMVDASPEDAIWYSQVIVSIAVFRVEFPKDVIDRLRFIVGKTKRNFFKKDTSVAPKRTMTEIAYDVFNGIRYPRFLIDMLADPRPVAHFRNSYIGDNNDEIEHVNLIKPLDQNKFHACVGDPERELYLHIIQLYSMFKTDNGNLNLYYYSTQSQKMKSVLNSLSDIVKIHVNHEGPIPTESANFVLLTDDGVNMDIFNQMRDVLKERLMAYSFKLSIDTKTTKAPGGTIINTPWKPPHEQTCRMVWRQSDDLSAKYDRTLIRSHHIIQDLFIRPFAKFETPEPVSKLWAEQPHLIKGEFDSEMEVFIVETSGLASLPNIPETDRLMIPPRAIMFHPDYTAKLFVPFVNFILRRQTSSVKNPLFAHASKCMRHGVYPPAPSDNSDHAKAIRTVFGGSADEGMRLFTDYMDLEGSRFGLLDSIKVKNIFPEVSAKQGIFPDLLDAVSNDIDKLEKMISLEPYSDDEIYEDMLDTFYRARGEMDIVVLGDMLGNRIHQLIYQYNFKDRKVGNVYSDSTPILEAMWRYVDRTTTLTQFKNIVEVVEAVDKTNTPITILVNSDTYPRNIVSSIVKKYNGTERLVGVLDIVTRTWTAGAAYAPSFNNDIFSNEVFRVDDYVKYCMVLGNGVGVSSAQQTKIDVLNLVVTDLSETRGTMSELGRMKRIGVSSNVFVENVIDENFITPTPDTSYDLVIVSPHTTRDMSTNTIFRFIMRLREEVINYSGEIKMLLPEEVADDISRMFPQGEVNISYDTLGDLMRVEDDRSDFETYRFVSIYRKLPSAVEGYRGIDLNTGENVRGYNNYVKSTIISNYLEMFSKSSKGKVSNVLDLACGKGQDMRKWINEKQKVSYVGIDGSRREIEEAIVRYKRLKGYKPRMKFMVDDIFANSAWVMGVSNFNQKYDVVSCQLAIHYAFGTERMIKGFLHNVSQMLERGGMFLVTTLDSDKIVERLEAAEVYGNNSVVSQGKYYTIEAPKSSMVALRGKVGAGVDYIFTQFPNSNEPRTTTEFVVSKDYFDSLCREQGLEILRRNNFIEYIGDDYKGSLDRDELELVQMYCSYEIVKSGNAPQPKKRDVSSVKKMFYESTSEIVLEASVNQSKDVLIFSPEKINSYPVFKGAKSITMITEDIDLTRIPQGVTNAKILLEEDVPSGTSYLKTSPKYDIVFLPGVTLALMTAVEIQNVLSVLKPGVGQIVGCLIDKKIAYSGRNVYLIPEDSTYVLNGERQTYVDMEVLRQTLRDSGAKIDVMTPNTSNEDLKIFSTFVIRASSGSPSATPQPENEDGDSSQNEDIDKFILSADQKKQKAAPGDPKLNEGLKDRNTNKYTDLKNVPNWRQLLSDTWEGPEFMINENESFKSVDNAILHFKGVHKNIPGYEAFNEMVTDVILPEGKTERESYIKPFRAVAMSSKVDKSKLETYKKLVYEAKFSKREYKEALLATKDAHLYTTVSSRNTLLEEIRSVLRSIVSK